MTKLDQQFRVRLPLELHKQISKLAENNRRSLNMEIVARLEESLHTYSNLPQGTLNRAIIEKAKTETEAAGYEFKEHELGDDEDPSDYMDMPGSAEYDIARDEVLEIILELQRKGIIPEGPASRKKK